MNQEQIKILEDAADVMRVLLDLVETATCERYTDEIRLKAAAEICELSSPCTVQRFRRARETFRTIANARTDRNPSKYRMTGSGFDKRGNDKDAIIREASKLHGVFVLWTWCGRQWRNTETFTF